MLDWINTTNIKLVTGKDRPGSHLTEKDKNKIVLLLDVQISLNGLKTRTKQVVLLVLESSPVLTQCIDLSAAEIDSLNLANALSNIR